MNCVIAVTNRQICVLLTKHIQLTKMMPAITSAPMSRKQAPKITERRMNQVLDVVFMKLRFFQIVNCNNKLLR
ncbi:MAG: hypothetical protein ACLP05_08565, partial [Candidatus Kryptoniota bacterium]